MFHPNDPDCIATILIDDQTNVITLWEWLTGLDRTEQCSTSSYDQFFTEISKSFRYKKREFTIRLSGQQGRDLVSRTRPIHVSLLSVEDIA